MREVGGGGTAEWPWLLMDMSMPAVVEPARR